MIPRKNIHHIPLDVRNNAHPEDVDFHDIPWYGFERTKATGAKLGRFLPGKKKEKPKPRIHRPAKECIRDLSPREKRNPASSRLFGLQRDIALALMIELDVVTETLSVTKLNDWHNKLRRPYAHEQKYKRVQFTETPLAEVLTFLGCNPVINGRARILPFPIYRAIEFLRPLHLSMLDVLESMRNDGYGARSVVSIFNHAPDYGRDFDLTLCSPKDVFGLVWVFLKALPETLIPASIMGALMKLCIVRKHATMISSDYFRGARLILCCLTEPAFNIFYYLTDYLFHLCNDRSNDFDINGAATMFAPLLLGMEQLDGDYAIPTYRWVLYNWIDIREVLYDYQPPVKVPIAAGSLIPMKNAFPISYPKTPPPPYTSPTDDRAPPLPDSVAVSTIPIRLPWTLTDFHGPCEDYPDDDLADNAQEDQHLLPNPENKTDLAKQTKAIGKSAGSKKPRKPAKINMPKAKRKNGYGIK